MLLISSGVKDDTNELPVSAFGSVGVGRAGSGVDMLGVLRRELLRLPLRSRDAEFTLDRESVRLSRSSAPVLAPDSDVLRIIATMEPSDSLLCGFGG